MDLQRFPRHRLTFGDTPIEKLDRLSAHLGGKVDIYAKREDCNSGLAFGGNKLRKLEYLIPQALEQGCDTLVTIGGIQSNHTRMVAAVAAKLGLACVLVQENWVDYSDAVYDRVGNIMMSRLMGADVRLVDQGFDIGFRRSWEEALEDVRKRGGKPYAIPAGASDHELGGLGYVGFAEEVRRQEADLGFKFDYIVVCAVTGSTQAGMVVGFAAQEKRRRVIGIDTADDEAMTRRAVTKIANDTSELIAAKGGKRVIVRDADIEIIPDYSGPAYGLPSEQTIAAIRTAAEMEAMLTDPVYEGKSIDGLIDMAKKGHFKGQRVLYAHLGGAPALNAYYKAFEDPENLTKLAREARYKE